MSFFKAWLDANRMNLDDLKTVAAKLFPDGEDSLRERTGYVVMLILSTIICTFGIISDADVTIIGAMIVAPLMTPIMATSAALVTGRSTRVTPALITTLASIVGVVLFSGFLGMIYFVDVDFAANDAITSRTAPRIVDLIVALAAGAAGAFAISRKSVADSLPGVAIAVALLPPLCVVGLSLAYGQFEAARGATLLFLTNFLAILLAGGVIFSLQGLGRSGRKAEEEAMRRRAYLSIAAALVLVAIPLGLASYEAQRRDRMAFTARHVVGDWAGQHELAVLQVRVVGNEVNVEVTGSGEIPPVTELGAQLEETLSLPVRLTVNLQSSTRAVYPFESN